MERNVKEILKLAQIELNAPKNQFNKFGGYAYRSCEDICEALKPLQEKYGFCTTLDTQPLEIGGRIYIEATACIYYNSEQIAVKAYAREEETKKGMDASQITGSATSYAKKYALNGLFLIDDVKDSDATNTHGKEATAPAPTSAPTLEEFTKKVNSLNSYPKLLEYWNSLSREVRESEEYKKIINARNAEVKQKK